MRGIQNDTNVQIGVRPARSARMIACLRDSMLYSEKRARDMLFDAVEQILPARAVPPTVSRLAREAAIRSRSAGIAASYDFSKWEPASNAVVSAMLNAGVLIGLNATPIAPGLTAQAMPVFSVADSFRDRTEAYLIEFLIAKLGDVGVRDHKALTHALFRQFDPAISMEDLEDRAVLLLATLENRVSLREDGIYAIRTDRRL